MLDTITYQIQFTQDLADSLKNGIVKIDETINTMVAVSERQSRGAAEQASALEATTATSSTIADTAREIADRAHLVDRAASNTISSSQDGKAKLELSRKEFSAIAGQMESIAQGMAELDSKFREIYAVAALIKDMSARTEVLSLNASIEAAGAGAEGRRFMVVAEETRLLSARSGEAAVKIRDLVGSIQKAALQSMTVTEAGKAKVVAGTRTIESALETLKTISSSAQSTFAAVKEITGSTSSQRLASEQVAASVSQIYTVAKQVEKGTMEINSAISGLQKFAEALRKTVKGNTAV
jgi:methyl-accepting chemotaxis protein